MLFVLHCLITIVRAHNLYFDKNLPDEETWLTPSDLYRARLFNGPDERHIDDSAMYNAKRFEGDIMNAHPSSRKGSSYKENFLITMLGVQRNAVRQTYLKWADGRIPYTISSQYSSYSRSKIAEAIEEYRKKTCIDFSPKSAADQDYIHIVPDDGCYSLVGRIGGKQPVSLGDGCIQKGIIIHELMHAVGFFHEQSRADRDDYVIINWNNVESGLQDQFDKYSLNMVNHLDTEYDYGSVMHYAPTAFSKNGKPTIEPRKKGITIGQRLGFSDLDLYKINKLYNCPQSETTSSPLQKAMVGTKSRVDSPSSTSTTEPSSIETGFVTNSPAVSSESDLLQILTKTCSDRRTDCEFLSRAGHCQSKFSEHFMRKYCPKSCDTCETSVSTTAAPSDHCEDSRSWCERWASNGMCTQQIFKEYMKSKCQKSCHHC
ncbi:Metalloendopeptidase [Trichostrongylus colubriformis]|uniref:Metalloendopeptidase n=1 Tax=Trichostrongylus colubriformis TaxID=6319 RepID=A0AAN8FPP9_TRICO